MNDIPLNDIPRQKLKEIITQHGQSLCDDPQRCEAFLHDYCGQYKKEIFLLVNALKQGVAKDLLNSSNVPIELLLGRLIKQMQNDLSLTEQAARYAVESWAQVLGKLPQQKVQEGRIEERNEAGKKLDEPIAAQQPPPKSQVTLPTQPPVPSLSQPSQPSYATSTGRAELSELRRLKSLLTPELQNWVTVEGSTEINPPLIRCEEIGRDEVEIQIDLVKWENLKIDQRNLLFWHEVARIQNDTIPREGWEWTALAIGLGGAVGELWVQDAGLLLLLALVLCGISGYRLWQKNNGKRKLEEAIEADEKAIALATRFGYSLPNAYKSLGSAFKTLIEQTPNLRQRKQYEARLQALRHSVNKAKEAIMKQEQT